MLIHEFRRSGETTRILDGTSGKGRLADFTNDSNIDGGTAGMAGVISTAEYTGRTALYQDGSTWLVKDSVTNEYVMGGLLRDVEQPGGGIVKLAADGWGKLGDNAAGAFFVQDYNLDQWSPGDELPFTQGGWDKIRVRKSGSRMTFVCPKHSHFRRNQAGNPTKWHNGFYRWIPGVNIKRIAFTIDKERNSADWFLEVVGASTPTGALTILGTYQLDAGGPSSVDLSIAGSYEVIGVRLARTTQAKHAPRRRFTIRSVRIGSLTQTDAYTLNAAFTELASRMGATASISASSVNVAPYAAFDGTYGQIADELALLDNWFWRLEPNPSTGAMVLNAGPLGKKTWSLTRTNSPVNLIPEQRYNQVRVAYRQGGLILHKTVLASPNPFPGGVFRTYNLDWDEPPHEDVATAFAQKAANLLAPAHASGDAKFTYVTSGSEKHGTAVMPGDQLTLSNHGGKTVTVEGVSLDPDGNVTSVSFMTGDPVLEKMLRNRQRLLFKGMSPDRATMGILEPEEPAAPTGVAIAFTETQKHGGRRDYDAIMTWNHSGEDIEGNGTYIKGAIAKIRPTDAGGTPIPNASGGGWRIKRIRNTKDTEDDGVEAPTRAHFEKIPKPHLWKWEGKVKVVDILNQDSEFSTLTTSSKPATFGPPVPTGVTMDVDQHYVHIAWSIPTDAESAHLKDQGVLHAQVEFDDNAGFTGPLKADRVVRGEAKTFRFKKPLDGTTYHGRVRLADTYGNVSSWVTTSGSTKAPPTPGIDTTGATSATHFDTKGTRKGRWRVVVVPTAVGAYGEDDIAAYRVAMVHHATAGASPPAGAKRHYQMIDDDATSDDLSAVFKGIPRNHTVWVRVRSIDRQGRRSPYSSWTRMGTPRNPIAPVDAVKDAAPATPTGVTVDKTHPRRIRAKWNDTMETDEDIDHYIVRVYQGASLKREVRTRRNEYVYDVPRADRDLGHRVRVYAADDLEQESSTYADQGADTTGAEVLTAADLGAFITPDGGGAQLGSEWLVPGTMTLSSTTGSFRTASSGARVELTKVDGADRIHFIPASGSKTVLEVGTDGIRWGGAASSIQSRLRQDGTLQFGETSAPAGLATNQVAVFARMLTGPTRTELSAKFGRSGLVKKVADSVP